METTLTPRHALHRRPWSARGCAILVVVHALATAFLWSSHIPYNAAPDEYEHIKTRIFVQQNGRLPHFNEIPEFSVHLLSYTDLTALYGTMAGNSGPHRLIESLGMPVEGRLYEIRQPYLFSPQLSHLLAGWLAGMAEADNLDALRCFNHLCLALAALATFLTGRLLWPRRLFLAVCAGMCVSLWPQMSYLGAYANDDLLAVTSVAFLVLCCVWIERGGIAWSKGIGLGVAAGLVLLSKYHAYPALFILAYWSAGKMAKAGRTVMPFALAALLSLAIASPWFIRNWQDYGGDLFGMRTALSARLAVADALPVAWYQASNAIKVQYPLFFFEQQGWWAWLQWLGKSYYCVLGWSVVTLPVIFYALPVLAGIGIFAAYFFAMRRQVAHLSAVLPTAPVARRMKRWRGHVRLFLRGIVGMHGRSILLFSFPLLVLCGAMAFFNSALVDYQPQGRYVLCSFPAIALVVFGALRPVRHGQHLALALLSCHQGLNILILACYL